jgi:hypothetical protein
MKTQMRYNSSASDSNITEMTVTARGDSLDHQQIRNNELEQLVF